MGPRTETVGVSILPFMTFVFERRALQEDIVIIENVPQFLKSGYKILQTYLQHIYCIETVVVSPLDFGWPMSRKQPFIVMRNVSKVDITKPFDLKDPRPCEALHYSLFR